MTQSPGVLLAHKNNSGRSTPFSRAIRPVIRHTPIHFLIAFGFKQRDLSSTKNTPLIANFFLILST
jgi:hypothetical protein